MKYLGETFRRTRQNASDEIGSFVGQGERMYFVYVLRCIDTKRNRRKLYVGSTKNIQKRPLKHKSGSTKATKSFHKIELIYYEACLNKTDALKRERQLKTGFGRGYLKGRLENYLKKQSCDHS